MTSGKFISINWNILRSRTLRKKKRVCFENSKSHCASYYHRTSQQSIQTFLYFNFTIEQWFTINWYFSDSWFLGHVHELGTTYILFCGLVFLKRLAFNLCLIEFPFFSAAALIISWWRTLSRFALCVNARKYQFAYFCCLLRWQIYGRKDLCMICSTSTLFEFNRRARK